MVIKIGDPIPNACDVVDNIPFGMLDGQTGTLQQSADVAVDDKPPESEQRDPYKAVFVSPHKLKVCDDDAEVVFAVKHYPLAVKIKKAKIGPMILGGDDFDHHGVHLPDGGPYTTSAACGYGWKICQAWIEWILPRIFHPNRQAVCLSNVSELLPTITGGNKGAFDRTFRLGNIPTGWVARFVNFEPGDPLPPSGIAPPARWRDFFNDVGAIKFSDCGLLYISSSIQIGAAYSNEYWQVLRDNKAKIKDFLEKGGGLISHEAWGEDFFPLGEIQPQPDLWRWLLDDMLTGLVLVHTIESIIQPMLTDIGLAQLGPLGITTSLMADENFWINILPTHENFAGDFGGLDVWFTSGGGNLVLGGFLDAFP